MPKQVTMQKCEHCQKVAVNRATIERHEQICIHNPEGRNCFVCKHHIYDNYYFDTPYGEDYKPTNFCNLYDDLCEKYKALKCPEFERRGTV